MFDFSSTLNLPFIFAFIIGTAIFLYVLLDGFDLGIGILFPFAPSDKCRDSMMNSIAPFWDGNETWLVLGGGGLFASFPLAYAILLPAFYIPIISMLLGLILRGVAFEFRFKADRSKKLWDYAFYFGSLIATFCQGAILGSFVQGIKVEGRHFAGGPFDWVNGFSIMTGFALIFGYILLGSTWLMMKTEGITLAWARKMAVFGLACVVVFMLLVTAFMPVLNPDIRQLWFNPPTFYYLAIIPLIAVLLFSITVYDLMYSKKEYRPFLCSIGLFLTAYIGLGVSLYPWIIPFKFTLWEAAASGPSLSLILVGVAPLLPIILGYTAYSYYIFRGKTSHEPYY